VEWLEQHWLALLGWGGSALLVTSLLQTRVLRFRVLNLVASLTLVAFNAILAIWPMVAMNIVLSSINVWFIFRLLRQQHDEAVFEVLETRPDDVYLQHVLRVHASDIAGFQPDFDLATLASTPSIATYLVQKGTETVGVVVLETEGTTARVRLDYVTPRYRDFSPGEFVWRRSGLLVAKGLDRVVTPPNMVNAYYEGLGFHREGSSYVLELRVGEKA
jgi:hypothetical protein